MTLLRRSPAWKPTYPGQTLREIVLPASGLGKAEAAVRLGVTRQALHRVLAGRSALSPEMAVRVSRLFGSTPEHWLAMQAAHDVWHIEREKSEELSMIERAA